MQITIRRGSGFTIIELVLVIVILCILGGLIALTASGVQAKNRNSERQLDIDSLRSQLESYYAQTNKYPTLSDLQDAAWRAKNLPNLAADAITDPRWTSTVADCTKDNKPTLAALPAANCYSYQVIATEGNPCDNGATPCAHYTLTAQLEGGETYTKSSLN